MEKRCTGPCGKTKPLEAFSRRSKAKDGRQAWCKVCMAKRKKELRRSTNPKKQREWTLKHLYGLTPAQWDKLLTDQAGRCNLCNEPMISPQVDHSHISGEVRGLLCIRCNTTLGYVEQIGLIQIEDYLLAGRFSLVLEGKSPVWNSLYRQFLSSSYN
jgi:hypothetical protein